MSDGGDRFQAALAFTLQWEGGLVDDPDDPGGLTYQGVMQRVYTTHRVACGLPAQSVYEMSRAERDHIYWNRYWVPAHCPWLAAGPDICQFDCAVNSGVTQALTILDTVRNTLSLASSAHGICQQLIAGRRRFLESLVVGRPVLERFEAGWQRRLDALARTVGV